MTQLYVIKVFIFSMMGYIKKGIMYDFAANVNVFAAKFSRLICNDFASIFFNDFAAIFGVSLSFGILTISRLNVTKSRLIINKFAANLYDFADVIQ